MVPGGGAEEKAPSPQPSPLPPSPAQAARSGATLPAALGSLHPHPSPSFPPPLTEPEPAAIRWGFRSGAERKTREPPRTGTSFQHRKSLLVAAEEAGVGRKVKEQR